MYQIINISSDPNQVFNLTVPDQNDTAKLALRYSSNSQGWVMDLTYGSIVITNRRLCASPNVLRQWSNVLPFGLACFTTDASEPYYIDDFANGRCALLVLSAADVESCEVYLSGLKDAQDAV